MRVAIYGYGNLGRGVELAVRENKDMELFGVFSRRDPAAVKTLTGAAVYPAADVIKYKDQIDVVVICGGSAKDLPEMTPMLAGYFNVVDSFDTHARIPEHFENVDRAAAKNGHTAIISGGWDPGMFSLMRAYASAVLPGSTSYTFWGRGVSQGHSDAIRRIPGVLDARQYTVPVEEALDKVRSGVCPQLTTRQKHTRECYIVAEEGADKAAIKKSIVTMPNYFEDYDTTVNFISMDELKANHSKLPHGGVVISTGRTGLDKEHTQTVEYKLTLDSNPEFTSGVLTALARAAFRLNAKGQTGCKTVFDISISDMSGLSSEELRKMI
ncbi:MAG: diaminopimelate dehydrogenase [Lachnospiraceae bacterium]|nr:diaminopimelate dehydrogenase [Lachnospiraceae bacterium]